LQQLLLQYQNSCDEGDGMKAAVVVVTLCLAGCTSMSAKQALVGPVPLESGVDLSAYEAAKARAAASPAAVAGFIREGEAAAVASCESWFNQVENYEAIGTLGVQEFNVAAAAGMTAAGIASANSIIISSLGAAFGAVNGLADVNLKAALAPSTYTVRERVLSNMQDAITAIEPQINTMSFAEGQIAVRRVESLCRPSAIRALISDALNATSTTISPTGRMATKARVQP
jgi:hypothetical protein